MNRHRSSSPDGAAYALLGPALLLSSSLLLAQETAPNAALAETPGGLARESAGAALRWIDVDGDARDDLFLLRPEGTAVLFRNGATGLVAANDEIGLEALPPLRSAEWLDVDGNGALDLVAVTRTGRVLFYRNQAGFLEELSRESGLALEGALALSWSDYDADGDPDVVTLSAAGAELRENDGTGSFAISRLDAGLGELPVAAGLAPRPSTGKSAAEVPAAGLGAGASSAERTPVDLGEAGSTAAAGAASTRRALPSGGSTTRSSSTSPPEVVEELSLAGLGVCVRSIEDVGGGPCLVASSIPSLGSLYPQTIHLNVDASNNRVGIGTVAPTSKLDVRAGFGESGIFAFTGGAFPAGTFATQSDQEFALDVRSARYGAVIRGEAFFAREGLKPAFQVHAMLRPDANDASHLTLMSNTSLPMIDLRANEASGDGADLSMRNFAGLDTLVVDADAQSNGSQVLMKQETGTTTLEMQATDPSSNGSILEMWNKDGIETVELLSEEFDREGSQLTLRDGGGKDTIVLDTQVAGTGGRLDMRDDQGTTTFEIRAEESNGEGARMSLRDAGGSTTVLVDAESGPSSLIALRTTSGTQTFDVVAEEARNNGAQMRLATASGVHTMIFDAETSLAAELAMYENGGVKTVQLVSEEASGNGAELRLAKADGTYTMVLDAETSLAAELAMFDSSGTETVEIVSEEAAGTGAQIVLRKSDGTASIVLDAEQGATGRITTEILEVTGGADIVEGFDTDAPCAPGSVVVIDPANPGALALSDRPYDARVAGIVSGAGGVRPGLRLGQAGVVDGETPVALSGRVFVRCNAENGRVRPGDLLTTSSTPGEAMRATDADRAFGAILGKAMGALPEGEDQGLVLALVSLQ